MDPAKNKKSGPSGQMGRIGHRPYWVLQLSIFIRALHQVGAAVFLTFWLVDGLGEIPAPYLWLAMVSGVSLVFTEWLRHRQMHRELSGAGTCLKLVLLGLGFHGILNPTFAVLSAFLLASIFAHAPKMVRHRLLY